MTIFLLIEPVSSLYIADDDPARGEIIEVIRQTCALILPLYALSGGMNALAGSLRGMGVSITNMVVSLIGVCGFRILWIATVFKVYNESPLSVYISYPISWSLTAGFHLLFMIFAAKKLLRENRERNDFIETKNLGGSKNELA
jgi:Na+-driven multidrug efflux pump